MLYLLGGVLLLAVFLFWRRRRIRVLAALQCAQQALARRNWAQFENHLAAAKSQAGKLKPEPVKDAYLGESYFLASQADYWRGELDDSLQALAQAVEHFERSGVPARPMRLSMAQTIWGDVCFDQGDLDAAAEHFRASVQVIEHTPNPALAIFALQRLADVLLEQNNYDEARRAIERCLEWERQILGAQQQGGAAGNKSYISMTAPDLALATRDYPRAEKLFREKVDYWSKMLPKPDNVDVNRYQLHLARAQQEQGKFTDALETLRQAVETAERDFGPHHPRVARARQKHAEAAERVASAGSR